MYRYDGRVGKLVCFCYDVAMNAINSEGTPRVYAFIDSQNLNVGVQRLGWKMDWRKFRNFLTEEYGVTKAYMFIGYIPEFEQLYEHMHELGFAVVLKPTFDMTKPRPEMAEPSGSGSDEKPTGPNEQEEKKPVKGNIDAELVLWAMKELSNYDKAVIVSGDGDFYCLIEYLEQKGRLLHLLAPSGQYSSLYNRYEEYIVRLDQQRRKLAYHDRHKAK